MQTINDFIKQNNLDVSVNFIGSTYVCYIVHEKEKFTFKMTRDSVIEHMRKFCSKQFVEQQIKDEKFVKSHFRRLAVTWWYMRIALIDNNQ